MKNIDKNDLKKIFKNPDLNKKLSDVLREYNSRHPYAMISIETLRSYTKRVLCYSYKYDVLRHQNKNSENNKKIKTLFLNNYMRVLVSGKRIVFLDEAGCNLQRKRLKRWGKRGRRVFTKSLGKSKNHSVLVINDTRGIIYAKVKLDSFKQTSFNDALFEFFESDKFKSLGKPEEIAIYLDNGTAHKSPLLFNKIIESGTHAFFAVPYHPHYNLTEYLFNDMKKSFHNIENREG